MIPKASFRQNKYVVHREFLRGRMAATSTPNCKAAISMAIDRAFPQLAIPFRSGVLPFQSSRKNRQKETTHAWGTRTYRTRAELRN